MSVRHRLIPIAIVGLISAWAPGGASAEELGLWGGWNDQGYGWQGTRPSAQSNQSMNLFAAEPAAFPPLMDGGPRPLIQPVAPPIVPFASKEPFGTIIIDTEARKLYYVISEEEAFAYPISVGREGFTWTGVETISRVAEWPDWIPPPEMRVRDPRLPERMLGGIRNPLGAVALFLGNSLYRIHGTNDPKTMGIAASSGCFRMLNENAVHLAQIAGVGTTVKVLPHLGATVSSLPQRPWSAATVTEPDAGG